MCVCERVCVCVLVAREGARKGGRGEGEECTVWVTKSSRFLLIEKRYFTVARTCNV